MMAEDEDLLALLSAAPTGQERPTLLLAAVHYLLLSGADHPLAQFYPSVSARSQADSKESARPTTLVGAFRSFCQEHRSALVPLIENGRTQTNDVRRAAALVLALQEIVRNEDMAIGLIEAGASAGLNLLYEQYAYRFGNTAIGGSSSGLIVSVSVDGAIESSVDPAIPDSVATTGIDLDPVDISSDDDVVWLRSFVWPELSKDGDRLMAAIELAKGSPPNVMQGDATELLPDLVGQMPDEVLPVVFHSTLLTYLGRTERVRFFRMLVELGATRPLAWIALESPGLLAEEHGIDLRLPSSANSTFALTATVWRGGRRTITPLALGDPYGRWIRSLGERAA
jgi:hypothetical protein